MNASGGLGTLGELVATKASLIAVSDSEYRVLSIKVQPQWNGTTGSEGGLMFGVCHSDYSSTEVEEYLEATTSIDRGDKIANERASRLVRIIGVINPQHASGGGDYAYNDGQPVSVKLNWAIPIGFQLNWFVYNISNAAYTTGSEFVMVGSAVVRYQ